LRRRMSVCLTAQKGTAVDPDVINANGHNRTFENTDFSAGDS